MANDELNDISPLESDEVYQYDELLEGYRDRTTTAVDAYRSQDNPDYFEPPGELPEPDPEPEEEDEDISSLESVKTAFYDELLTGKREITDTETQRFATELQAFAQHEIDEGREYVIPESEVTPLDVEPDEMDPLESNTVSEYDEATASYNTVTEGAVVRYAEKKVESDAKSQSAFAKLDTLSNTTIPSLMNSGDAGSVKATLDDFDTGLQNQLQDDLDELTDAIRAMVPDD